MKQQQQQLHRLKCQECKKEHDDFAFIRLGQAKRVGQFIKIAVCYNCFDEEHFCSQCGDKYYRKFLPPYDSNPYCSEECYGEGMG